MMYLLAVLLVFGVGDQVPQKCPLIRPQDTVAADASFAQHEAHDS